MLSAERERLILEYLEEQRGLVSFQALEARLQASAATIRRDLTRLTEAGLISRFRGGAKLLKPTKRGGASKDRTPTGLLGVPFHENIHRHRRQKELVGRAAAKLCTAGAAVMIDGGSTTLQMCPYLSGLNLTVLTNSLHIVSALSAQAGTRVLIPAGQVFAEQNIVLAAAGDDGMSRFHAPKLFMGAAALGPAGLMQADIILVNAERHLIERANEIVVLVDSSKFAGPSGHVVCPLEDIDFVVTDAGISAEHAKMLEESGVRLIVARE
jgi:DeoR family ulaG and ulaABCDEF operon transcriptional repressor